jgi:hypothetical protein
MSKTASEKKGLSANNAGESYLVVSNPFMMDPSLSDAERVFLIVMESWAREGVYDWPCNAEIARRCGWLRHGDPDEAKVQQVTRELEAKGRIRRAVPLSEGGQIRMMLAKILERLELPSTRGRTNYTVKEAAELLGRAVYTVREWCQMGRINALKRRQKRAKGEVWSIEAEEIERYRNEGLLPIDPERNVDCWADLTI